MLRWTRGRRWRSAPLWTLAGHGAGANIEAVAGLSGEVGRATRGQENVMERV